MSVGEKRPGRDPSPLAEARRITRDVIRQIPAITEAEWRDYCGVHLGLPPDIYAEANRPTERTVKDNVRVARRKVVRFMAPEVFEQAARDFIAVEVEGKTVGQQASNRGVSKMAVRGNIRKARSRLPRLANKLEAAE